MVRGSDPDEVRLGDLLAARGVDRTTLEIAAAEQEFGDSRRIGEILVDQGVGEKDVQTALSQQQVARAGTAADSTIRVDVSLLDDLMNLVGELVLTRNEIMQLVAESPDGSMSGSAQRLNIITSELQEGVMKTRMQPIGNVWGKIPRLVRDLSQQFGKSVHLEMEGKDTELDKSLLEAIKDPLTHIVRNTLDHGIEPADVRAGLGKPAEGLLRLTASHEGGQVIIEITDDGAGIDPAKLKRKAIERGLLTADAAAAMRDTDAIHLIFAAGFSTAAKVTNVSGRGVGMDVVKTNIEKIGGSVEVRSEVGEGTTFKLKIPLTLAIIPALIVGVAGKRYAIPQINLIELVRVDADDAKGIEYVHGAPVFRLRGRLLPVVDLRSQLGETEGLGNAGDMVVLSADDHQFGMLVDDIYETQEIVVKPLGHVVTDLDVFSGATILGDGRVALIIDVLGLAQESHIIAGRADATALRDAHGQAERAEPARAASLLLLRVGGERRVAMALSDVARLEEFDEGDIEHSGHRPVVQYRDQIMPLVDLGSDLGYGFADMSAPGPVSVVVYTHRGRDVGLVIDEVLDIVDEGVSTTGSGGDLVVRGRVTEQLDVDALPTLAALEREQHLVEVS